MNFSQNKLLMSSSIDLYNTFLKKKDKNLVQKTKFDFLQQMIKTEKNTNINKPNLEPLKTDKIERLLSEILKDEKEGIKSPDEIHSPSRKRMRFPKSSSQVSEFLSSKNDGKIKLFKDFFQETQGNNNTTKEDNISNINSKKINIQKDSKFNEIQNLKHENSILKRKISDLEDELKEIDEFRIALNYNFKGDLNEKRIALLKGQLTKQRKYIKSLLKTIQLFKKFYRDTVGVLSLFKSINSKYSENILYPDKIQKKFKNLRNENSILKEFDEKQKHESIQEILHTAKNGELLEKFILNFNEAYEKVKDFERKNEELKNVFEITDETIKNAYKPQFKKLKYTFLLQQFVQKYKGYFPMKTCFDVFDPREKDSLDVRITNLIGLMNKTEETLQKVSCFELLKNNPFYQTNIPDFLNNYDKEFEDFLTKKPKGMHIVLNYDAVSTAESSLSLLLTEMVNFKIAISQNKETISIEKITNLQSSLRSNIEKLLHLGIVIDESDDNVLILQNKQNFTGNIGSPSEIKTTIYKLDPKSTIDFQKTFSFLSESFLELEEIINPTYLSLIKKIKVFLQSLYQLFEQKKLSNFLKELDLSMLSQQQEILRKSVSELEKFTFSKIKNIENFIHNLKDKSYSLLNQLDNLQFNTQSVNHFSLKIKNFLKKILKDADPIVQSDNLDSTNALRSLEEEFKVKCNLLTEKWAFFNKVKKIENPTNNH